ncbi:MAG: hypothetical protein KME11_03325 [Timaviella obliquedivisa GSE-PSE-MK23-08B]|nr:hypothetical protein [Timaviella obliquedivisa GSE-PSE-MK23-08B]
MSKLLILSCVGVAGLMTACGLKTSLGTGEQLTVKPPVSLSATSSLLPVRPSALPVPSLIPPVGALPTAGSIGGRPDPFSALPLTPTVVIKQNPVAARPSAVPSTPMVIPIAPSVSPSSAATVQQAASLPTVTVPATTVPGSVVPGSTVPASAPSVMPPADLPASVPSAPTLALAQAIAVSGVVQAGSQTSVIVQVPNETTSRSAVVGDYLANGKVLVKRIEMQGAEPVVVLEQDGAEFIKPVGSGSLGTL